MLCTACLSINLRPRPGSTDAGLYHILHPDSRSFEQALAADCPLCLIISGKLDKHLGPSAICDAFNACVVLWVPWKDGTNVESAHAASKTLTVMTRHGVTVLDKLPPLPELYRNYCIGNHSTTADQSSDKTRSNKRRKVARRDGRYPRTSVADVTDSLDDTTSGSSHTLGLARLWLNYCLTNHRQCKATAHAAQSPMPTRLINIEQPTKPWLVQAKHQLCGPYVALSYAWGQGRRVVTRKSNVQMHLRSLPVAGMPSTFADAIRVAVALGYKYIWIDAFCIIQDDDDDLSRELPRMGDIYRYADLTIYAAGAKSSHTGFFKGHEPPKSRPCHVPITYTTSQGSITHQTVLSVPWHGPDYLGERGWILQERVLSPRCLIFGDELAWSCTTTDARESNPVMASTRKVLSGRVFQPDLLRHQLFQDLEKPVETRNYSNHEKQSRIWQDLVQEYSEKQLSFAGDNLKALSGLAEIYHQAYGMTYAAGIWQQDAISQLAWYVAINDERPVAEEPDGPSWTWASAGKIRIRFRACPVKDHLEFVSNIDVLYNGELLGMDVKPANAANPYGAVTSGRLVLRVPLQRVLLSCSSEYAALRKDIVYDARRKDLLGHYFIDTREEPRYPGLILDPERHEAIAEAALDRPIGAKEDGLNAAGCRVWCALLQVHHVRSVGQFKATMLLLKKHDDGTFSRLGLGYSVEDPVPRNKAAKDSSARQSKIVGWLNDEAEIISVI
ncbi:hypothetical protein S7711_09133 [Stachybotrys chartarum IBT 7711]|uniref:Heterokaryon incompatibility domain-containing protein n=1 Tax=Stachybotrys chartarum (strain CBS 109288 / IBT 7711) TaxID=1280523 RepID=A0A084B7R8_STACB|nr:hypothetical protein S7711_09133 [Stachybotrys chartarum IBT 7711]